MTSKLEEVARAIFNDRHPECDWNDLEERERNDWLGHAQAALMAMKGPTEGMIKSSHGAYPKLSTQEKYRQDDAILIAQFEAMIDAALEER